MEPKQLQKTAEENGWSIITTKNPRLISFVITSNKTPKKKIRCNVYWTTGTIGICIPHHREKFKYQQTMNDINKLFQTLPEGL